MNCENKQQGSNTLSRTLTQIHIGTLTYTANTKSQPRWAEDKNSISCWLLLQKCAFLGYLSPSPMLCSLLHSTRSLCFRFVFPFLCTHTNTLLDIQCMHVCMQLQQACFKMCGKREKEKKNWSKKQEKRAKLHFRRCRCCCCRLQLAAANGQWRGMQGGRKRGNWAIDSMQLSAINGQPPTQRLAPKRKTSQRLAPAWDVGLAQAWSLFIVHLLLKSSSSSSNNRSLYLLPCSCLYVYAVNHKSIGTPILILRALCSFL